ncbi:MAG: metal-sensitive transcriptional regulator [Chloroflexota bacterium]|nr:MAG: metal-sensitive transcriptional regulator [Chloroflexota bacterium]
MEAPEERIIRRLHKIEGQVRGLERMVEQHRACDEVLIQVLAARAALDRVAAEIIGTHVEECLTSQPPEKARESIARILRLTGHVA